MGSVSIRYPTDAGVTYRGILFREPEYLEKNKYLTLKYYENVIKTARSIFLRARRRQHFLLFTFYFLLLFKGFAQ